MSRIKKHWMKTRKDHLTRSQEAALPGICEKWRQIALSTAASDRTRAQEAARRLYEGFGYPRPRIIWIRSPLEFTDELHQSQHKNAAGQIVSLPDFDLRHNRVYLGAARFYTRPVVDHVWRIISRLVPALPRAIRLDGLWSPHVFGPADARHFALADFFRTERHRRLEPFMATLQHCGSFVPYQRAVVFLERPSTFKLDEQGRLHSFDGPALVYRDGSANFAIHGLQVDRKWIETPADQISTTDVLAEANAEVRTALIAKIGFPRLLHETKHKVISKRKGNALIEFAFPGRKWAPDRPGIASLRLRALHLTWRDKTGPKETMIPVPRTLRQFGDNLPDNIDSVEQVRRWTLGWPKEAIAVAET
jgi:hypothetical protein